MYPAGPAPTIKTSTFDLGSDVELAIGVRMGGLGIPGHDKD